MLASPALILGSPALTLTSPALMLASPALTLLAPASPALAASTLSPTATGTSRPDAEVTRGTALRFPDDEGSHPDFRIEWWYVTGWLRDTANADLGFQVTFFRHRNGSSDDNPSRFAPRQLIVVHAAIADPRRGKLLHVQRVARAAFDRAAAGVGRTDVHLGGWALEAASSSASGVALPDGRFMARIADRSLALNLVLTRTQTPLLHGDGGYSQKGPDPSSASHYYTLPHLAVTGSITTDGRPVRVEGSAWLDHEWSSAAMDANASGWDWIGINFDDGGALMAFRMRDRNGGALWASATHRDAEGRTQTFAPNEVRWTPSRQWRSPRTGALYSVAWRVEVGGASGSGSGGDSRAGHTAGALTIDVEPMMDDQEQDARITTGTVYWEGAVTARRGTRRVGRGYLEMTGYAGTFRL